MENTATHQGHQTAQLLAELDQKRQSFQISAWEYETTKQRLLDPTAHKRAGLVRKVQAVLIAASLIGIGLGGFAMTYPHLARETASFAWDVITHERKNFYEQHVEFVEDTEDMVDGWFNPDQTPKR